VDSFGHWRASIRQPLEGKRLKGGRDIGRSGNFQFLLPSRAWSGHKYLAISYRGLRKAKTFMGFLSGKKNTPE